MDDTILNESLTLALEWGEQWLQPIQERLAGRYPDLPVAELDRYDARSREAMNYGHNLVPRCWREPGQDEEKAFAIFREGMLKKYPWISEDNLRSVYSQGMYYAWRNGEIPL